MVRTVVALLMYVSSLAALAASATIVRHTLLAFPDGHLQAYGPRVPAFSQAYAESSPILVLAFFALASLIAVGYAWARKGPTINRDFAIAVIAALNFAVSSLAVMNLIVAFFMLPKLANAAL